MLTVNKLILAVRMLVHDTDKVCLTDEEILAVLNAGNRFVRRQIRDIRPQMLFEAYGGTLPAGSAHIDLPVIPAKIVDVCVEDSQITPVNVLELEKPLQSGEPRRYYLTGRQTLCFYPVPTRSVSYRVRLISDAPRLTLDGQSSLPSDLDDFLIEYARIRLSLDKEFNLPQETQLLEQLRAKVQEYVIRIEEPQTVVRGYW